MTSSPDTTPTTQPDEEEVLPALYWHCVAAYENMEATAQLVEFDDDEKRLIWTGHLTRLVADLHLSTPYFTFIRRSLTKMKCIRQIKRGGGSAESQWELLTQPTPELWETVPKQQVSRSVAERTRVDKKLEQSQQIRDLQTRMNRVEQALGILGS